MSPMIKRKREEEEEGKDEIIDAAFISELKPPFKRYKAEYQEFVSKSAHEGLSVSPTPAARAQGMMFK